MNKKLSNVHIIFKQKIIPGQIWQRILIQFFFCYSLFNVKKMCFSYFLLNVSQILLGTICCLKTSSRSVNSWGTIAIIFVTLQTSIEVDRYDFVRVDTNTDE